MERSYTMTLNQLIGHLERYGKEYPVTLIINGEYYDLSAPARQIVEPEPEFWEC